MLAPRVASLRCLLGLAALGLLISAPLLPAAAQDQPAETPAAGGAEQPAAPNVTVTVEPEGVSVYAVNADAHEVFTELAEQTGLPLIVDDTVKRAITVNIVRRQPREIIDLIVDAYGVSSSEVDGVIVISEGMSKNPSSYLLSDIDSITTEYVQAPQAKSLLPVFLQDQVKINPGRNAVVLSAPRAVLDKFRADIEKFDVPAAQLTLDVLVVEFTDTTIDQFSAQFGYSNAGKSLAGDSLIGQLIFQSITSLPKDFFVKLNALQTEGKARVRANPRIATVSGHEASIFIGQQRYLSTPVQLPSTSSSDSSYSSSIDAGVRLDMTPLTGGEGEIILTLNQEVSTLSAPDPTTGLPNKTTRSGSTVVRVYDGETIVIGGLRQEELRATRRKVPVLGDLPLVGPLLFRSKHVEHINTELALFITPRLLSQTGHLSPEEEAALMQRFGVGPGGVLTEGPAPAPEPQAPEPQAPAARPQSEHPFPGRY